MIKNRKSKYEEVIPYFHKFRKIIAAYLPDVSERNYIDSILVENGKVQDFFEEFPNTTFLQNLLKLYEYECNIYIKLYSIDRNALFKKRQDSIKQMEYVLKNSIYNILDQDFLLNSENLVLFNQSEWVSLNWMKNEDTIRVLQNEVYSDKAVYVLPTILKERPYEDILLKKDFPLLEELLTQEIKEFSGYDILDVFQEGIFSEKEKKEIEQTLANLLISYTLYLNALIIK